MRYTIQHVIGLHTPDLFGAQVDRARMTKNGVVEALARAYRHEIDLLGINTQVWTLRRDQVEPFLVDKDFSNARCLLIGFQLSGLDEAQVTMIQMAYRVLEAQVISEYQRQLGRLQILTRIENLTKEELTPLRVVDGEASASEKPADGESRRTIPLHQFAHDFFKSHLGMSDAVSDAVADLFMGRWRTYKPVVRRGRKSGR